MKKLFLGLKKFFMVATLFLLLAVPSSLLIAAWDCPYITMENGTCISCHGGFYDVTTVTLSGTPNDVYEGGMFFGYDTSEMSYYTYAIEDCLIEEYFTSPDVQASENVDGLSLYFTDLDSNNIPGGETDCLITLAFINNIHPDVPDICMSDLEGDIEGWCELCCDDSDCDDGVACTGDSCVNSVCQHIPGPCDDSVGCTDNFCDPTLDCQFTPNDANCDDSVGCTDDTCNPILDCQFTPNDANCEDGEFCNGAETCDSSEDCQPGTDPCRQPYLCDEVEDVCAQVALTVEPGWIYGDVGIKVDLCLDNEDNEVGGVQVDVCDEPDCLECVGCELTERSVLFDCFANELEAPDPNAGCCRVILMSKNPGGVINPGICSVVKIDYSMKNPGDPGCEGCITLTPENMTIPDPYSRILTIEGISGEVCPFTCGDVYPGQAETATADCGDGKVDLLDIMEEVDFALGADIPDDCQGPPGATPIPYGPRDDVPTGTPGIPDGTCDGEVFGCCPRDGNITIFDIMVLIDMVLGRQDCCSYYYTGTIY